MSDAADRGRAESDLTHSLVVSAGAGSGKTTVLVSRVLELLEQGTPCADIAVVTFTEKAAGELQERVRDGLEGAVSAGRLSPSRLEELPDLTMTTLHGFARDLLSRAALQAGWAPATEIVPRGLRAPGVAAAITAWRTGLATRHPDAVVLVRRILDTSQKWEDSIGRLLATRDSTPVVHATPLSLSGAVASLQTQATSLQQVLAGCTDPSDAGLQKNRLVLTMLQDALAQPADALRVSAALFSKVKGHKSAGRAANWPGGGKAAMKQCLLDLDEWRADLRQQLHRVVVLDARTHLLPAVADVMQRDGLATFDDLLFRAAALLGANPAVRARLAARFPRLLIDEVQDTDPLQAQMAALLTRDQSLTGAWTDHPPQPGHLFAVGDAKQSIYRFRRADVQVWEDLRTLVPAKDRLELTRNFRSVPGVVEWVNHTFSGMPGYTPQQPVRGPASLDPVVRLVAVNPHEAIVRWLHRLKGKQVVDSTTKQLRALRWEDVMVVLPAWSQAEDLAQHLARAGIPAAVEGGRQFFDRQEVQLSLLLFRALDDPADTEATAQVLRGMFGLSFQDLLDHHNADGSLRYTLDPPKGPVADALAILQRLHRARSERSLTRLLDEALEESGAAGVWSLLRDGQARLANLDKVRTLVRELEEMGATHGEVLQELTHLSKAGDDEDLSRLDVDLQAVRITSVFKAKGREAPVVLLAFQRRSKAAPQLVVQGDQAWVKLSDLKPPDWEAMYSTEQAAFTAERDRWMYVGATRARDQLVVVDKDGDTLLDCLRTGLPGGDHDDLVTLSSTVTVRIVDAAKLAAPTLLSETFPALDSVIAAAPFPTSGSLPRPARAKAIKKSIAGSQKWVSVGTVARAGKTIYGVPGGVGKLGGTVVHEVLERVDLHASREQQTASLPALLDQRASLAGLGTTGKDLKLRVACLDILQRTLKRPELDLARAAPFHWREVPFTHPMSDGTFLHGVMDLAFPLDRSQMKWMVIDWKSTLPPKDHPSRAVYESQLKLYAKALITTVAPCAEVETALVGPHPELGQEGLPELDLLYETLLPVVEGLVEAGAPIPEAGIAIGAPEIAQAELAWPDEKVCLLIDYPDEVQAVEGAGWTVVHADSGGAGWEQQARTQLQALLCP